MCCASPDESFQYRSLENDSFQAIEDDDSIFCWGLKRNYVKLVIFHIFSIIMCGTPYLFLHWFPHLQAYTKCSTCTLDSATYVLLYSEGQRHFYQVKKETISFNYFAQNGRPREMRYFIHQAVKVVWNDSIRRFCVVRGLDDYNITLAEILERSHGYTLEEQQQMLLFYGENAMPIEVKSYWSLFVNEVLNPFYIFQIFSVTLWSFDDYYYYAGCVLFLSAISMVISLWHTRQQSVALSQLAMECSSSKATVQRRHGSCTEIDSKFLVPGDVIVIPPQGCLMTCDAILLTGSCIVNESMLTGESVPVTKTQPSYADATYNVHEHKRHTLFAGTRILQTRFYPGHKVCAVVVRTGFSTSKGELIRSIMFPKPVGFKFYQDSVKFICILFVIALIGMAISVYIFLRRKTDLGEMILRSLDIVTIVVPPSLPAAMTSGTIYSQNRLKKLHIYCISPPRINVCGKMKVICFDKTGTLTEEGLSMWGVLPCNDKHFSSDLVTDIINLPCTSHVISAMATCHSLTRLEGELVGDPLDISMFESIGWELDEPGCDNERFDMLSPTVVKPKALCDGQTSFLMALFEDSEIPYEIGIIRQFPFSSTFQCMTVITKTLGNKFMTVYCKGAPEKIRGLCREETVPDDFNQVFSDYASKGYRVIALAYKDMDEKFSWKLSQRIKRDMVECDLTFIGLIVLCNSLKDETVSVISQLRRAQLRCMMVTGDNILTAVSVARDCGMVLPSENILQIEAAESLEEESSSLRLRNIGGLFSTQCTPNGHTDHSVLNFGLGANWHFAVDGPTWKLIKDHHPHLIPHIATKGTIFARMAPDQKSQLVEALQNIDYIVAFCGDGANDCAALKLANIGISLSEAEASVAAPFTSKEPHIECVLHLAREGRCALVTSFGLFKYMALYSLIQFFSILLLYDHDCILGNAQFLYVDLVITTSLTLVMGLTGPSKKLVPQRPVGNLASPTNVIPVLFHILLVAAIQVASLEFLLHQKWYKPAESSGPEQHVLAWETTTLFFISCFQYLVVAALFSKGQPHRMPFYTNCFFTVLLIVLWFFTAWLLLFPWKPVADFMEVETVSSNKDDLVYRAYLLGFSGIHMVLASFVEMCMADRKWFKKVLHFIFRKRSPKNRYKKVSMEMTIDSTWLAFMET